MQAVNKVSWLSDTLLGTAREQATTRQPLLSNGSANKHVSTIRKEYNRNERDGFYVVFVEIF
jgi:hypothetical protein